MRGREFTMKDAYSFDRDAESAGKSYEAMVQAYRAIFERMGLGYRAVAADTGAIGGDRSHEFQVIAETGEDAIVYCPDSDYAANIELAEALAPAEARREPAEAPRKLPTPDKTRCEDVAEFLGIPVERTVKAIVLAVDRAPREPLGSAGSKPAPEIWLLLLRGDHTLNEVKASKLAGLDHGFRFATEAEIVEHFASPPGYLGPLGVARHAAAENSATAGGRPPVRIVADRAVAVMSDFVCGANEDGFHIAGVNWGSYLPEPDLVADIRNVVAGDPSPDGKGSLLIQRGIEVGHVFYLGAKYSAAMNATFLDETGKPRFFEMGCYGIGVTRIAGAAIEQNHDERGIVWPRALAPFEVVICPVGWSRSAAVREAASALYEELRAAGIDVVLDDRDERPGVMFADWELIGIPLRVTVGDRGLKDGRLEIQARRDPPKMEASSVELSQVAATIEQKLATL
jgi:prolyl-tRNA synthetase